MKKEYNKILYMQGTGGYVQWKYIMVVYELNYQLKYSQYLNEPWEYGVDRLDDNASLYTDSITLKEYDNFEEVLKDIPELMLL